MLDILPVNRDSYAEFRRSRAKATMSTTIHIHIYNLISSHLILSHLILSYPIYPSIHPYLSIYPSIHPSIYTCFIFPMVCKDHVIFSESPHQVCQTHKDRIPVWSRCSRKRLDLLSRPHSSSQGAPNIAILGRCLKTWVPKSS